MRWYRLGVNATVPDDQFMNFWFALEIVAEFQKSSEKVSDKCAVCGSPLYCGWCKGHSTHKPYPRQAIRALLKSVDENCDDAVVKRLDRARNGLMHGSTLEEIEEAGDPSAPPHEHVVNVLGHLVWRSLLHQFPRDLIAGTPFGYPNTYLHHTLRGIMHLQTIVPAQSDGDLDLDVSLRGITAEVVAFGPPQSALPTRVNLNAAQMERLTRLAYALGDQQTMCRRVFDATETHGGTRYNVILSTDMRQIESALKRGEKGAWQDLFREILTPASAI